MKTISITVVLLLALSIGVLRANAADFYVATNGSDAWSGKLSEPKGNNGPFATLERARDAVRDLKTKAGDKDIVVLVREGTYRLERTVVFGLEDSGTGGSKIT